MNIGDRVQLKSGGPLMAIVGMIESNDKQVACCLWWNCGTNRYERFEFPIDTLAPDPPLEDQADRVTLQGDVKIGDIAYLKSGGPIMTVKEISDVAVNTVGCIWSVPKQDGYDESWFPIAALAPVSAVRDDPPKSKWVERLEAV